MAIVLFAGVAAVVVSDDSTADSSVSTNVTLSDTKVVTGGELIATLSFTEVDAENFVSVSYSAKLVNSDGATQSGALSSTSGTFTTASVSEEITITAPSTAGRYTIIVEFTEKYKVDGTTTTLDAVTAERSFRAEDPVVLSVTVANNGTLNITDAVVYFYVDGVMIEDSKTLLSVAVGETTTISYNYYDKDMDSGKHTYSVHPADQAYMISGLGENHTFYYEQSEQTYLVWIMAIIFVFVLIIAIWVFRKPVRNYGKPKARR